MLGDRVNVPIVQIVRERFENRPGRFNVLTEAFFAQVAQGDLVVETRVLAFSSAYSISRRHCRPTPPACTSPKIRHGARCNRGQRVLPSRPHRHAHQTPGRRPSKLSLFARPHSKPPMNAASGMLNSTPPP